MRAESARLSGALRERLRFETLITNVSLIFIKRPDSRSGDAGKPNLLLLIAGHRPGRDLAMVGRDSLCQ